MVIKKVPLTDREVENVSRSATRPVSQVMFYAALIHSLRSLISLSVSHLVCYFVSSSVILSAGLTLARSPPPVCQSLRVSESVVNSPVKASQD